MLNKIANIEASKGYNSSGRRNVSSYEKYLHSFGESENLSKDSVQFSPAAVFLAAVNWKLAEINRSSENELNLNFYIEDVHFLINIDFTDFYRTTHQKILMEKKVKTRNGNTIQQVELFVQKPPVRLFEKYPSVPIEGIQALFSKISKLKLKGQLQKYETFTFSILKDGIEESLYDDFVNIFFILYSFIAKLGGYGISKSVRFPSTDAERIIFEKITVKNA